MARATLEARIDPRELEAFSREVRLWASDQLPFAAAAACTDTAKDARDEVAEQLGDTFTVRNRGLRRAITFEAARKRDRPIQALVAVRPWAPFLATHATGGTKRARAGRVAIPTRRVKRTASGRVRKKDLPRVLREDKRLVDRVLEERGQIALAKRGGTETFFSLRRSARIRATWPFEKEVRAVVDRRMGAHFERRARQALETARPRA